MGVSYIRPWKILLDKRMKKMDLKEVAGISNNTLAKLSKDEYVSMESVEHIFRLTSEDLIEPTT